MNTDPIQRHEDSHIGVVMDRAVIYTEQTNCDGTKYWKATQQIGSLFGSNVNGECEGIGRTKEEALARLQQDIHNLSESLWA